MMLIEGTPQEVVDYLRIKQSKALRPKLSNQENEYMRSASEKAALESLVKIRPADKG